MTENHPRISVIIPTYNRPDDMQRTLDSLSRVEYPCWDTTIIDQSDDARTQATVESFMPLLPHLRYRRVHTKNASRARNVGIEETTGEIIALLDDDCTVKSDWLAQVALAFGRHPRADLVLGELRPCNGLPEWSSEGWTPARFFPVEVETNVAGSFRQRVRIWPDLMGNGACMFVRRSTVQRIGFFDVHLGGGGRFHSAEDGDYIYRAHMAGCTFVGTPAIVAEHHGLRDYKSGAAARLTHAYYYGIAAYFMKELRLGDPVALIWILREAWRALALISLRNIILRRGPTRLRTFASFTQGLVSSFALRVDRQRKLYAARTIQ